MNYIGITEFALIHGKSRQRALKLAKSGRFKTAEKIGRHWVIDKREPWVNDERYCRIVPANKPKDIPLKRKLPLI